MGKGRDTDLIRIRTDTKKRLQKIAFTSKQNDNKAFDNISKIIDFMFNSLKDITPLKELLK